MAEVVLDPNFQNESYSDDDIDINNNDLLNYRGYFQNNDDNDEDEPKYFEHGAHFPYYFLYQKLEIIKQELESREIEPAMVKNKTEKRPASTNIFGNNNNIRSRNRNNIQIDFTDIPKVNNEIEIENDNSKQHVNASAIVLKMNKEMKPKSNNDKDVNIIKHLDKIDNDKGSKNKLTESVNVYTAFATKLKMNKKLNFSKKETANEEEIAKLNSGTNLVNKTSKTKTIHLSNEKTQKAAHSTTKTKNKLEKKIKVPDTTIYKKSRSKSKELSSSYHKSFANKATSNKNQSKLIANSINNILTSYKHKRNFNFSPGLHPQPTKIKGTANKGSNNLNEILAAISKTSYHKSRNIGALTNNLTNTKSNLQTERDKRNLTQQNNINNIGPNYTMMKTQPVLFQKKSPNPNIKKNKVNLGPASRNEVAHNNITNKTSNFLITNKNYHNMMSNAKNITTHTNTKESNVNSTISKGTKTSNTKEKQKKIVNQKNRNNSNKKFKTYLDIKLNLYQKSNDQILNEIRKTIFVRGNSSKKQKSTSKSNKTLKGPTSMKTSSSSNTRNTKKDNSNININININNNKIVYNKIVNINTKLFENNKEKDVCKVAFNAKANLYSEQNKGKNNNIGKNNVIGCKSSSKCNGNNRNSNLNMHSNSMSRNKYYAKNPTNNTTSHIGQNKKMNFNITLPQNANAVSITKAK